MGVMEGHETHGGDMTENKSSGLVHPWLFAKHPEHRIMETPAQQALPMGCCLPCSLLSSPTTMEACKPAQELC